MHIHSHIGIIQWMSGNSHRRNCSFLVDRNRIISGLDWYRFLNTKVNLFFFWRKIADDMCNTPIHSVFCQPLSSRTCTIYFSVFSWINYIIIITFNRWYRHFSLLDSKQICRLCDMSTFIAAKHDIVCRGNYTMLMCAFRFQL